MDRLERELATIDGKSVDHHARQRVGEKWQIGTPRPRPISSIAPAGQSVIQAVRVINARRGGGRE
jgi:hypothetical protein